MENRFQAMREQGKQIQALLEQGKQIAGHERTGKTDFRPWENSLNSLVVCLNESDLHGLLTVSWHEGAHEGQGDSGTAEGEAVAGSAGGGGVLAQEPDWGRVGCLCWDCEFSSSEKRVLVVGRGVLGGGNCCTLDTPLWSLENTIWNKDDC